MFAAPSAQGAAKEREVKKSEGAQGSFAEARCGTTSCFGCVSNSQMDAFADLTAGLKFDAPADREAMALFKRWASGGGAGELGEGREGRGERDACVLSRRRRETQTHASLSRPASIHQALPARPCRS